ncbi:hypothetical protein DL771_007942 [Monosporascus sp. 5C6A]|nr:hypothetical protein DL771_007942 [Monosporascus sp. 5C6A]
MADQPLSEIIKSNPIGKGLDALRTSFISICEKSSVFCSSDALGQPAREDAQDLAFNLLSSLQILPAARHLRSKTGHGTLRSDLLRLNSAVDSDDFDFDRIKPLLNTILADKTDKEIWDAVYDAVAESTPPPRPIASSLQQTPWLRNTKYSNQKRPTDGLVNSQLRPTG